MRIGAALTIAMLISQSSLAAASGEQPICPDRPSKSTGPCTVPQGRWQIETGLVDWSRSRSGGVTSDATSWGNSAFKYGIAPNADVELWLTPLETLRTEAGNSHEFHSSFGDALVRVKYEVTKSDAPVQIALDPFIKIPTANHQLGNGKVEGGLLIPVQVAIGKSPFTISLDPELDWIADQDGSGHHLAMIQLVNLGWQASKKITLTTEVWRQWDWDPAGTGRQLSVDGSLAYLLSNDLQLDAGANFGLNRQTPRIELYSGVSVRF